MEPKDNKPTGEDQAGPTKTVELINFEEQAVEAALVANLPSLKGPKVEVAPVDLMEGYWSPEIPDEDFKDLYYVAIRPRLTLDQQTGEVVELDTAFFLEETEDGWKSLCNSSARLVARFQKGDIPKHTPVRIVYRGKVKNATNANLSARWSVYPLMGVQ